MKIQAAKINYSSEELKIIDNMDGSTSLSEMQNRLLFLMSIHKYYRSKKDLSTILYEYPQLDDKQKLEECIELCIKERYLSQKEIDGVSICFQSEENFQTFLKIIPSQEVVENIKKLRENYQHQKPFEYFGLLSGAHSSGKVYTSFISRLKGAQKSIWLPMLNTAAHEETIRVLKERASDGVKVYILMADYKCVVQYIRAARRSNISDWINQLQNVKNVEIRIYRDIKYAQLASSVMIDDQILRLPIYDSCQQKSSDGHLIEFNRIDAEVNIVRWVKSEMLRAWNDSAPASSNGKIRYTYVYVRSKAIWAIVAAIILCIMCYRIPSTSNDTLKFFESVARDLLIADITYLIIALIHNNKLKEKVRDIIRVIMK